MIREHEGNTPVELTEEETQQAFPKEWVLMAVNKKVEEDEGIARGQILCHSNDRGDISIALGQHLESYPDGESPFQMYIFHTERNTPESIARMDRFLLEERMKLHKN